MADPDTGGVVQEQYFVNFLRGVTTDEADRPGRRPRTGCRTPRACGEPAATTRYGIDADQTFRYAEASGDRSVYHLDDAAARAAGFDGIIVHGLCTMAFASRAVVARACGGRRRRGCAAWRSASPGPCTRGTR